MKVYKKIKKIGILTVLIGQSLSGAGVAHEINSRPLAPGKIVSVAGSERHLYCAGEGHSTVVLEAGLGGNSLDWSRVFPQLTSHTRVCAYDRAGYGWSDMGSLPRTGLRSALELHELLEAAGEKPPFVLVGHSYGGFIVRLFASRFPDKVAGVILVDASHERQFQALRKSGMTRRQPGGHPSFGGVSIPNNLPKSVQAAAKQLGESANAVLTLMSETHTFQLSGNQAQWMGQYFDAPMTVLTRGEAVWGTEHEVEQDMERTWQALQSDLYQRFGSRHFVVEGAGHYIHLDKPQSVVDAVLDMLKQASIKLAAVKR